MVPVPSVPAFVPKYQKEWESRRKRGEISAAEVIVFPHREKTMVPVPSVPVFVRRNIFCYVPSRGGCRRRSFER
jgi:hypothetical protein